MNERVSATNNAKQHWGVFERIRHGSRRAINQIKNNDPDMTSFYLDSDDSDLFTDLEWELLGDYVAENDYLEDIDLDRIQLTDAKMSCLFKNLTRSSSLREFDLTGNNFGFSGIQNMIPFLKNSPNLIQLRISQNDNINTECFGLIVNALRGSSIQYLILENCSIGDITALEEHVLPCLQKLDLDWNNIKTIPSLQNCRSLETLYLCHNSIEDITALDKHTHSHLRYISLEHNSVQTVPSLETYGNLEILWLKGNKIGKEGCISIANMLRNGNSSLERLDLESNDIDDEGAEIIANSLKRNTKLKAICLRKNGFERKGCIAFLKLLNDVSSIETTYNSNHTLTKVQLPQISSWGFTACLHSTLSINQSYEDISARVGRTKVIRTQLNIETRMEHCRLQCIDSSYSSLFAEIDPVFLPNILSLVVSSGWQNEVYQMLLATAPALTSLIDKKAMLKEAIRKHNAVIAKHEATIASLIAQTPELNSKKRDLKRRLDLIDFGAGGSDFGAGGSQSAGRKKDNSINHCGKKRCRSRGF